MSSRIGKEFAKRLDAALNVRANAHRLLDSVLDEVLEQGFFGGATLDLASQNGNLCKCEADIRRRLRPPGP